MSAADPPVLHQSNVTEQARLFMPDHPWLAFLVVALDRLAALKRDNGGRMKPRFGLVPAVLVIAALLGQAVH